MMKNVGAGRRKEEARDGQGGEVTICRASPAHCRVSKRRIWSDCRGRRANAVPSLARSPSMASRTACGREEEPIGCWWIGGGGSRRPSLTAASS